jgi:hypothetical protein
MENMSKLVFKKLFIFSSFEKLARVVEFSEGKTMITSSSVDGTDRGKSVIMKSLYQAMGADCFFEDKWDDANKTYILLFSVGDSSYYIFRHANLFKVFDDNKNLFFSSVRRHELAEKLFDIFHFAVKLPAKKKDDDEQETDKLEITPPAYNYLLYFVDQDKQNGSQFASFRNLSQYSDYKTNVLFYHFGTFDDTYYDLAQQAERLEEKQKSFARDKDMMQLVLERIYTSINGVSYSADISHLQRDVERTKKQYNEIAKKLSEIRQKLISLRNDKEDLFLQLCSLTDLGKENDKQIKSFTDHICPVCESHLDDDRSIHVRIKRYNTGDDIILLSSEMQIDIKKFENEIAKLEAEYSDWLRRLSEYENALNLNSSEINDVLRHKGFMGIKDKLVDDMHVVAENITANEAQLNEVKKALRKYNDAKKAINERYYALMLGDRNRFGLEGIDPKSFEDIKRNFTAGGSNNPISTIVWYINLIRLKHEFNPDAIDFPVVFDSPNNAETDQEKRDQIYHYICERITDNQLIVSGIGFAERTIEGVDFDSIINLTNEKYELLCTNDFQSNADLLRELTSK